MDIEMLAVLLGLVTAAIGIAAPIFKLTNTITHLTVTVENLEESLNNIILKNHDAHLQIWEHNKRQDKVINEHDRRIAIVETKVGVTPPNSTPMGRLDIDDDKVPDEE